MKPIRIVFACLLFLMSPPLVSAFESEKRPILYPNAHYDVRGEASARADVEDCWQLARETGARETSEARISQQAASDAAALAVFGAAAAAALGGDPHRAAVAGAVGGGSASIAAGMLAQDNPPAVFRAIVERCLFEKGYEVAGWE